MSPALSDLPVRKVTRVLESIGFDHIRTTGSHDLGVATHAAELYHQGLFPLVGDTQRISEYARRGFAIEQDIPADVDASYQRLVDAGFASRLI